MQDQFPAMWRIVRYMNWQTDVAKRKAANRKRRLVHHKDIEISTDLTLSIT